MGALLTTSRRKRNQQSNEKTIERQESRSKPNLLSPSWRLIWTSMGRGGYKATIKKRINDGTKGKSTYKEKPLRKPTDRRDHSPSTSLELDTNQTDTHSRSLGLPPWPSATITLQKVLGKGSFGTVFLATENRLGECENDYEWQRQMKRHYSLARFTGSFRSLSIRRTSSETPRASISDESRNQSPYTYKYAVKRISKRRLSEKALLDVKKEIDIHCNLGKSINVIYIYGAYEDEEFIYIVLEYCSGGVLYQRIKRGDYSESTAAGYVRSMLRVLAQCHSHGVVHRDLKPDNFLFLDSSRSSPLKATDFGLAAFYVQKNGRKEMLHDVTGTPYYMAPEVVLGNYSKEADLWSLGVVVFQLLTGKLPFKHDPKVRGKNASIQVLRNVLHQEIEIETSPLFENVSQSAKELVKQLLIRDPKKRITVEDALSHPWVKLGGNAPTTSLSNSVVQRLQNFGTYSWLKQRALLSMVSIMSNTSTSEALNVSKDDSLVDQRTFDTPTIKKVTDGQPEQTLPSVNGETNAGEKRNDSFADQADEIASMFSKFDTDSNGTLDFDEMRSALIKMDFKVTESEILQLFDEMDIDKSGTVDYEEFTATLFNWTLFSKTETQWTWLIKQVFDEIDSDGDQKISVDEIRHMFQETTGEEDTAFATALAEEMLDKVDLNSDGEIDFHEFRQLLQSVGLEDYHIYATAKSFNKMFSNKTLNYIRRKGDTSTMLN